MSIPLNIGADGSSGQAVSFSTMHAREVRTIVLTLYEMGANGYPSTLAVSLCAGGAVVAVGSATKQTDNTYAGAIDLDQTGIVNAIGTARNAEFSVEVWDADAKNMIGSGYVDVYRNDGATGTPTPTPTDGWEIVTYEGKRMLAWTFPDGNQRVLVPRIVDGIETHSWIEV
jgi:hypothetical protein